MIVFNLVCESAHAFEGWFRSLDDFSTQRERGLVNCPVCGSAEVQRTLSAPRINLGADAPVPAPVPTPEQTAVAAIIKGLRNNLRAAENVGERFAEEARRIHYRESPARSIRGQATGDEYRQLQEEGIDVMPLPDHWMADEKLN